MFDDRFAIHLRKPGSPPLYYIVGSDGVVTTTPVKTRLKNDPDKWYETESRWARSASMFGVTRTLGTPYEYVNDATLILRHIAYTEGREGICQLEIDMTGNLTQTYIPYFLGDINFSQGTNTALRTVVDTIPGGLRALIDANIDVVQEIPILDADCVQVNMAGMYLQASYNYTPLSGSQGLNVGGGSATGVLLPNAYIDREGAYETGEGKGQPKELFNFTGPLVPFNRFDEYHYKAYQSQEIVFEIAHNVQVANDSGSVNPAIFVASLIHANNSQTILSQQTIYQAVGGQIAAPGATTNFLFSGTSTPITMAENDRLYLIYYITTAAGSGSTDATVTWFGNPTTSSPYYQRVKVKFQQKARPVKGYRHYQVFEKLIEKIGGALYSTSAPQLTDPAAVIVDSRPYHNIVFCGDALRGLGDGSAAATAPKIKTSLGDYLRDVKCSWGLHFGTEGDVAVINTMDHFFNAGSQIADLGVVKEFEDRSAEAIQYTSLKIGVREQTYDNLNGRDEPNTTQSYKFPMVRPGGELDLTTPYRYDMYGMANYQANLDNKQTTDSTSDNDVFVVEVDTTTTAGAFNLWRPASQLSATGLLYPDGAFNLTKTPKRCFDANAAWIAALCWNLGGKTITFQTTDKNPNVAVDMGSGLITENADVPVSSLPDPPFIPWFFNATCVPPEDLWELQETTPYGYYSFNVQAFDGTLIPLKGFTWEIRQFNARREDSQWTLLCHPDVDLTTLTYR